MRDETWRLFLHGLILMLLVASLNAEASRVEAAVGLELPYNQYREGNVFGNHRQQDVWIFTFALQPGRLHYVEMQSIDGAQGAPYLELRKHICSAQDEANNRCVITTASNWSGAPAYLAFWPEAGQGYALKVGSWSGGNAVQRYRIKAY